MFAVLQSGGKQYRVSNGDLLRVEKLDQPENSQVVLDKVVMLGDGDKVTLGAPFIDKAAVVAEVLQQGRDKKIIVFKRKRRQNYRRTKGHRQAYTLLRVVDVLDNADASKLAKLTKVQDISEAEETTKKAVAKKTVAKKAVAKKTSAKKASVKKAVAKASGKVSKAKA